MMLLTSGQMWNHIRGAQFYEKDQQSGQTVGKPFTDLNCTLRVYVCLNSSCNLFYAIEVQMTSIFIGNVSYEGLCFMCHLTS